MKQIISIWLSLLIWDGGSAASTGQGLSCEILGIRLNMTKDTARKRLQDIGTFVRDEAGGQEIWKVRDDSFAHLIIGLGKDGKLNYITAVAREDKDAKGR